MSSLFVMGAFASSLYSALMWAGSLWCHQMPERSPHLWGAQLPLCWRCTGIALGASALVAWLVVRRRLPPTPASLLLALPLPLDVLHAALTDGAGANSRRLLTGLLWGFFATSAALDLLRRLHGRKIFSGAAKPPLRAFAPWREFILRSENSHAKAQSSRERVSQ